MKTDVLFISTVDPTMLPKLEAEFAVHKLPASGAKDFPAGVVERIRVVVTTGGAGADHAYVDFECSSPRYQAAIAKCHCRSKAPR